VDQRAGASAELVESRARHGVAGEHHGRTGVVEAVGDARLDRAVIGRSDGDGRRPGGELDGPGVDLDHLDERWTRQVVVVGDAVADVGGERGQEMVDDGPGADRADDTQRRRLEREDPLARDHVVEIGDVVAVEVGQQHGGELRRPESDRGEAHQGAASGIDEVVLRHVAGAAGHERRRPGAVRVGDRPAGAEQRDRDHWRPISTAASAAAASAAGRPTSWISTACSVPVYG
jgi:hypothetical protein